MRQVVMLIAMLALSGTWSLAQAAEQTRTFAVAKMTCPVCPVTVRKAIEKIDGVTSVNVDLDAKTATVRFDDAVTTTDAVAAASTNAGYPAHLIDNSVTIL